MSTRTTLVGALGLLAGIASAQVAPRDRRFIHEAYQGNRGEVVLGRIASTRGASRDIREFGNQMVRDHGRAASQIQRLAYDKRVTVPTRLSPDATDLRRRLLRLRGSEFDRLYRDEMIEDHRKDIAEFQREATAGRDPAVRSWARKTLPTLRMHLRMIQAAKVGAR